MARSLPGLDIGSFDGATDGAKKQAMEAVEAELDADESIRRQLIGKGKLRQETAEGTNKYPGIGGAKPHVFVTDDQLIFAVDAGEEFVISVPYLDISRIESESGLLKSKLAVKSWHDGSFRLTVKDSQAAAKATEYISTAVECWQYTTSMLDRAKEHCEQLQACYEDGRFGDGRTARQRVHQKLEKAQSTLEKADIEASSRLQAAVDEARRDLHRTEIDARLVRANTLVTEAKHQSDSRAYADAAASLWEARDHLETARMLARQADMDEPPIIERGLETINGRIECLRVQPLTMAKQTRERAERTETLTVRIDQLEAALEHYQDALTAGWGTDFEFEGSEEHVRFQIEIVVGHIIKARQEYADRLRERASEQAQAGKFDAASETLGDAMCVLDRASDFANEFRSGDPDEISVRLESLYDAEREFAAITNDGESTKGAEDSTGGADHIQSAGSTTD